jgi:hypothetical protein
MNLQFVWQNVIPIICQTILDFAGLGSQFLPNNIVGSTVQENIPRYNVIPVRVSYDFRELLEKRGQHFSELFLPNNFQTRDGKIYGTKKTPVLLRGSI